MKKLSIIFITISIMASAVTVNAAPVPRESVALYLTDECVLVAESLIADILTEVQNGLGYAGARAKTNRIIFNAWLDGKTNGYSYGDLTIVANNAIWQYRDMYLRPEFYAENESKVKAIIADVITQFANGEIDFYTAEKLSREKIYQSINPNFDLETEMTKDTCYRDIPSVDNSLFTIARKLLLEAK